MARNIVVDKLVSEYIEDRRVKIVERKGIGHRFKSVGPIHFTKVSSSLQPFTCDR